MARQSFPKLRCTVLVQFLCQTIEASNSVVPAQVVHTPVLTVTKREQWQDPDTEGFLSVEERLRLRGAEEHRVFVPRGSALAFYTFANQAAVDSNG